MSLLFTLPTLFAYSFACVASGFLAALLMLARISRKKK